MLASPERLTKKQKRILRQERVIDKSGNIQSNNFKLKKIQPLTQAQIDAFESFDEGYNLFLHGFAGTGKTFIALYLALDLIQKVNLYKKVYIVRSVVPSRDMGFLPGNAKEKTKIYETPYYDICNKLYGRGDAYDVLKTKNILEFISTSFIRGITLDDCIVIVDEMQNMNSMELHSIMTRIGENCKIVFSGDINQDDLTSERKKEYSGLRDFMRIIERMKEFDFIDFTQDDIVRSQIVKSYIIERHKLGMDF